MNQKACYTGLPNTSSTVCISHTTQSRSELSADLTGVNVEVGWILFCLFREAIYESACTYVCSSFYEQKSSVSIIPVRDQLMSGNVYYMQMTSYDSSSSLNMALSHPCVVFVKTWGIPIHVAITDRPVLLWHWPWAEGRCSRSGGGQLFENEPRVQTRGPEHVSLYPKGET